MPIVRSMSATTPWLLWVLRDVLGTLTGSHEVRHGIAQYGGACTWCKTDGRGTGFGPVHMSGSSIRLDRKVTHHRGNWRNGGDGTQDPECRGWTSWRSHHAGLLPVRADHVRQLCSCQQLHLKWIPTSAQQWLETSAGWCVREVTYMSASAPRSNKPLLWVGLKRLEPMTP